MVSALLCRKFRASLAGDEVAERRDLTLEFARLVSRVHPVGDFISIAGLYV